MSTAGPFFSNMHFDRWVLRFLHAEKINLFCPKRLFLPILNIYTNLMENVKNGLTDLLI